MTTIYNWYHKVIPNIYHAHIDIKIKMQITAIQSLPKLDSGQVETRCINAIRCKVCSILLT